MILSDNLETLSQILQKILSLKKNYNSELENPSLDWGDRFQALLQVKSQLLDSLFLIDPHSSSFTEKDFASVFLNEKFWNDLVLAKSKLQNFEQGQYRSKQARGVHTILVGQYASSLYVMQDIFLSLLAGNYLFVLADKNWDAFLNKLSSFFKETVFKQNFLFSVNDSDEVFDLSISHPSISLISAFDLDEYKEKLFSTKISLDKSYKVFRPEKTAALILEDSDINKSTEKILQNIAIGCGQFDWNISRVFVLSSIEDHFKASLLSRLEEMKLINDLPKSFVNDFEFIFDASSCLDLHQKPIRSPKLLIQSIKYAFEVGRWLNVIPNQGSLIIFGPEEKASKLRSKIWNPKITINPISSQEFIFNLISAERSPGGYFGSYKQDTWDSFYSKNRG